MRCFALLMILLPLAVVQAQLPAGPDDFPQWRGANRDGMSADKGLLKQWPAEGPEVRWRIENIGAGYSSVAIKDDLIVTMGDLDGVEHTIALNRKNGARVWATQPGPVAEALQAKVNEQYAKLDANEDGTVDETEALTKFGWDFYQYDRGDGQPISQRAKKLFASLDNNSDGQLVFSEAGKLYRDHVSKMDSAANMNKQQAAELAKQRTNDLFAVADANSDGKIDKKEARDNYTNAIFSKADKRLPDSRRGDQVLTRDEVQTYLSKRERGQDGQISSAEFVSYYEKHVSRGDGQLTRSELSSYYGGYRNGQGDGPRGTPTIDGDRVYAEGGNGDLSCLDLRTGKNIWYVSLTNDLGGSRPGWGYSESPLVVDDWVIVTPGGDDGTLAALDKMTGDVVWRSTDIKEKAHYSSPIVTTIAGKHQIVQFARQSMFGVSIDTGKLLWQYDGANNSTANCCTPVVHADHVFAASAYGTGGGLAKITNDGEKQKAEEVYFEKKMAIHHGGIIKIGDYMYTNGGGTLMCVNFLTGDIAWQDRSVGKGSLAAADGMLYVLSEKQKLALVEATPEDYRERGLIEIESQGRPSWAHPVIAGGVMYIRDQHTLTAYNVR